MVRNSLIFSAKAAGSQTYFQEKKRPESGLHASAATGVIAKPNTVARRLSAATLRCSPQIDEFFARRVNWKYTMRASLCATAVLALGLSQSSVERVQHTVAVRQAQGESEKPEID